MAVPIEKHAEPIPGYRLIDRLGGGGFGEVWRAEAPGGLLKAIKFVYGDLQDVGDDGQRAEQELKALSRVKTVRHPYILSLERFDIIDGQLLIVTELADRNLWDRYKECRGEGMVGIPRSELLDYLGEVAEALDLMNLQYGLQHLDIKPQNLFLVHQHIKVGDFGLVKDLEGMRASVTGGVTPVYAAPETFDGWVSRFSDQYSLAIVYQELLTGQRPFTGATVRQLVMQHLQAQPNLSALPEAERVIIGRALAKHPDERFPTCKELIQSLRQVGAPPGGIASFCAPESGEGVPALVRGLDGIRRGAGEEGEELPDGSADPTHCLRGRDDTPREVETPAPSGTPPDELRGEGALFPALVIGVGDLGRVVLQQLTAAVHRRHGSRAALPNLRLLLLDTDPGALKAATGGKPEEALYPQEVLLTPLNRPAHYLKSRDGRAALDSWLNQQMLYRIPRARLTMGVRALGRLAFCDHYRAVARRLRTELEACLDPEALATAVRETGAGLHSNRPRVYVVAGLAGGTGGGMFLDLAYVLRAQLRQLGYGQPDVVGLFAIPEVPAAGANGTPAGDARHLARTRALGNSFAALTELNHFATPGRKFSARYHENEAPVVDTEPPFHRCVLLPLRDERGGASAEALAGLAAEFLIRELCSPLGEAAAGARAAVPGPAWAERGLYCQTFGLFRWSSPRRLMMQQAARRLCARLVERWMSKDAAPVRDAVAAWVDQHWQHEEWGPESVTACIEEAAQRTLGRAPDEAFAALLEPLAQLLPADPRPRAPVREAPVDQKLLMQVVNGLEAVVGPPPEEEAIGQTAELPEALRGVVRDLVAAWGQKVAELMVQCIERPEFRLAGAEEAARQVVVRIEQVLAEHEPKAREAAARASETYRQVRTAAVTLLKQASGPAKGRPAVTLAEVVDLCRRFASERYHALVWQQVIAAYVSLRGQLSDQLREVNYCRARLDQLLHRLRPPAPDAAADNTEGKPPVTPVGMPRLLALAGQNGSAAASHAQAAPPADDCGAGPGRWLFPGGCRTLDEAVEQFLERLPPESLQKLDGRVQEWFQRRSVTLVQVCLSSANMLPDVERGMAQEGEIFVSEHAAWGTEQTGNVTELFLAEYPEEAPAREAIAAAYEEADPGLTGGRNTGQPTAEVGLLLAPANPAAERVRELARAALPEVTLQPAPGEDLVLYRERPYLPLADLEQLGTAGEEAYRQMLAMEHFTPHSRLDVAFTSL